MENVKYMFLRTVCSGKYCDVRRMRCGNSSGYYIARNCVIYRSPNIVRIVKCRTLVSAGYDARMRERRTTCKTLMGKPTGILSHSV